MDRHRNVSSQAVVGALAKVEQGVQGGVAGRPLPECLGAESWKKVNKFLYVGLLRLSDVFMCI